VVISTGHLHPKKLFNMKRAAFKAISCQEQRLPFISSANTRIYYRLEGRPGAPVLVFSHSLGCDHGMWAPQVAGLIEHFQILRYDGRGHGASDVPAGEYTLDQLGQDVLRLADALNIAKFAFCGLSMGGGVGQWLAVHAPKRLTALVIANSSPRVDAANLEARRQTVLAKGIGPIADSVMQRFFSPETLAADDPYAASVRSVLLATHPIGYAGCCAALRDADLRPGLERIQTPTLVIVGDRDQSTPWPGHGEVLAGSIKGAKALRLPTAHLSNLERPQAFSAAVLEFLLRNITM
jgi:3-oxoadipate enol-lactonase